MLCSFYLQWYRQLHRTQKYMFSSFTKTIENLKLKQVCEVYVLKCYSKLNYFCFDFVLKPYPLVLEITPGKLWILRNKPRSASAQLIPAHVKWFHRLISKDYLHDFIKCNLKQKKCFKARISCMAIYQPPSL